MGISIDQVMRIFIMLECINFAKMRNEFESAATFEKIAAGENALDVALKIVSQFVPPIEIAPNDLEILMPVLGVIAQVAAGGAPFPIPDSRRAAARQQVVLVVEDEILVRFDNRRLSAGRWLCSCRSSDCDRGT